jgi:membrane protease YdiL (CAAX protease family)
MWIVVVPIVFLIHFACTQLLGKPTQHPIAEAFVHSPPIAYQIFLAFQAVLFAPLIEEWFFRGVLLRWQLTLDARKDPNFDSSTPFLFCGAFCMLVLFRLLGLKPDAGNRAMLQILIEAVLFVAFGWFGMIAFLRSRWLQRRIQIFEPRLICALFANSLVFGALHANVWPTPIPLFFLALALCWLAIKTNGVWASFLAHSLFNAISTLMLFFSIPQPDL